eukprot:6488565-Amphidinium_carterae.1
MVIAVVGGVVFVADICGWWCNFVAMVEHVKYPRTSIVVSLLAAYESLTADRELGGMGGIFE